MERNNKLLEKYGLPFQKEFEISKRNCLDDTVSSLMLYVRNNAEFTELALMDMFYIGINIGKRAERAKQKRGVKNGQQ